MSRTMRLPHRNTGRCRPRLERLESRLALSGAPTTTSFDTFVAGLVTSSDLPPSDGTGPNLTPVATAPAQGDTLATPPATVTVTFDRPLDPTSLGALDVEIQAQQGGSWVEAFAARNAPAENLDPTGSQLILTLPQALTPGTYRLVLPEFSQLNGTDFSTVADLGHDHVLATFTVDPPAPPNPLSLATPLGSPVSTPVTASGSLDLQKSPGAVDFYTFTLPAGHQWRLGAEIAAQRVGSPLQATLSLFDSQGRLIDTASVGRPDAPHDPYLFEGLAPGTYFLGVSGHNNVPGTAAGYDPSTEKVASNLAPQAGGTYQLNVVADPADAPTRVLGSSLQYADPIDPHPTGFALAFSGPIDVATLRGGTGTGIEVVNQHGKSFPITAAAGEAAAQYDFLFNQDMPAGTYSIIVPDAAHGGLTDLAGYTPVAPGLPAGVLATFTVRGKADASPTDLGPLYRDVHSGISRDGLISPGAGVTYRFVVTTAGKFELASQARGGSAAIQLFGSGGGVVLGLSRRGEPTTSQIYLEPGVYYVQFVNAGKTPVHLSWTLRDDSSWESLLDNGVGQGPALDLRLISPTTSGLAFTPAPEGALSAPPPLSAPAPVQTPAPTTTAGGGGSVAPAGLFFTLGNTLVGRPSTQSDHVAAVGPASNSGSPALASSGSGVPQGIGFGTTPARFTSAVDGAAAAANPASPSGRPASETSAEPVNGALVAEAAPTEARSDEAVLAAAEWLTRAGNVAARWMALAPEEVATPAADAPAPPAEPIALARDGAPSSLTPEGEHVESAQLDAPLVIGLATAMSFRYHPPFVRWLKRTRASADPKRAATGRALRGPHTRI